MLFLKLSMLLPLIFIFSCTGPGADSGFAPGAAVIPASSSTTTANSSAKYGETKILANQWQVSNDQADPIEQKTLPNGWQVEVKYE